MPIGIYPRPPLAERFWSRVNKNGPVPAHLPELGPCWIWTGCGTRGYGRIRAQGHHVSAPRVAMFLANGRWPEPCALHKCDGGSIGCVRPDHLFEGTTADNNADTKAKGRTARGTRHGTAVHPERVARGERAGLAKLTELAVLEIRDALTRGERQRDVAARWGVSQRAIGRILSRKTWAHVPERGEFEKASIREQERKAQHLARLDALRPDIERIHAYAQTIRDLPRPVVKDPIARMAIDEAAGALVGIAEALEGFRVPEVAANRTEAA